MVSGIARIVAAVCVCIVIAAATTSKASTRSGAFVIRNIRIFDGEKIITANSVAVTEGKIAAVGSNVASPAGAQVIENAAKTLGAFFSMAMMDLTCQILAIQIAPLNYAWQQVISMDL